MMALADAPVSDSAGSDAATWCPYCFSIHLRAAQSASPTYPKATDGQAASSTVRGYQRGTHWGAHPLVGYHAALDPSKELRTQTQHSNSTPCALCSMPFDR